MGSGLSAWMRSTSQSIDRSEPVILSPRSSDNVSLNDSNISFGDQELLGDPSSKFMKESESIIKAGEARIISRSASIAGFRCSMFASRGNQIWAICSDERTYILQGG